ncbi:MAG: thioredoxin family protein [Bacteroidota bacterium]
MILLDFHATWCEPCKWSEPIVDQVVRDFEGEIVLQKIDIDEDPERARSFNIRSVPTFVLIDGPQEIWRMNGFDTAIRMTASIREAINKNSL